MISTKLSTELFHCFSGVFPLLHIPTTPTTVSTKIILYIPIRGQPDANNSERKLSTIMKLRFQKDDIVNGISIVMKAVPSKTTMSILECILIDASSGEIKLTGNDMELGIETTVNGEILEHGKIALDAKLFFRNYQTCIQPECSGYQLKSRR